MSHKTANLGSGVLRTAARFLASLYIPLYCPFVGMYLVGESGWPEFLALLCVGVTIVGYLLAFKWETLGGAIGLAAAILCFLGTVVALVLPIPGVLFLAAARVGRGAPDGRKKEGRKKEGQ